MTTRHAIASSAARQLSAATLGSLHAVLGFDGFVDEIIEVVEKRHAHDRYDRVPTIARFGEKICAAANTSCNFELVVTKQKLGGNGPIMANALAALGLGVTYIGTVGDAASPTATHPVFQDFSQVADLIPLAPPAHTNALEFLDGKLMLGNLAPLSQVTWPRIIEAVGRERLARLFEQAVFIGMVNWTMLPHLTSIWQKAAEEILPALSKKPRRIFIDLADPDKRTEADLAAGLDTLLRVNDSVAVTLGLNLSEAVQVGRVLGIAVPANPESVLVELAGQIRAKLPLDTLVIHPRKGAAAANDSGAAYFAGPFVQQPRISTGAGDHFNAGFALGQLLQLSLEESLCVGTATSGYYVRNAASPTQSQLAAFLQELPDPQP